MSYIPTTVKNKNLVEKRREQIIHTAISLFSKKGFHKTTLRDLAKEAGISHGNIYDYVGTKEDILFLIHEFLDNQVRKILLGSIGNVKDPIEKLRRMIRAEFNMMGPSTDGILLLHREAHVLKKAFLHRLLAKERSHLELYESVIQECIEKRLLNNCNVRLASNLIKAMIDSWVTKRWDLRPHTNPLEAERTLLDVIFFGLLKNKNSILRSESGVRTLKGKVALIVNAATPITSALTSMFLANGVRVATYHIKTKSLQILSNGQSNYERRIDEIGGEVFESIEDESGPVDFLIQDLGLAPEECLPISPSGRDDGPARILQENLTAAQKLCLSWKQRKYSGRIVFLAPSPWDDTAESSLYEMTKASTIALTQSLARKMSSSKITVNGIVPRHFEQNAARPVHKHPLSNAGEQLPEYLGYINNIINTVVFLIGEGANYITGQVIEISGCIV